MVFFAALNMVPQHTTSVNQHCKMSTQIRSSGCLQRKSEVMSELNTMVSGSSASSVGWRDPANHAQLFAQGILLSQRYHTVSNTYLYMYLYLRGFLNFRLNHPMTRGHKKATFRHYILVSHRPYYISIFELGCQHGSFHYYFCCCWSGWHDQIVVVVVHFAFLLAGIVWRVLRRKRDWRPGL